MRRFSTLVALTVAAVTLAARVVEAQAPTPIPACYSTSPDYIDSEVIVAVQPSSPVLVRRFQAPNIRIFCVHFEENGPACGQTSTPVLCSRPAYDTSAAFSCETLTDYIGDPNANVERGTINGEEMVWDLMWDGTNKQPQCYPRAVRFRAMVLVRGKDVSSTTVFIVMLLLVIPVIIAMFLVFLWFIRNRLRQIDEAGATTIAGPKPEFTGPQMAVGAAGAPIGVDKVYLPMSEDHGALAATDRGGTGQFGQLESGPGIGATTPAMRTRRGPKRPSPPAPGDGLAGGPEQFRGAQRTIFGNESADDDDFGSDDDDDLYYRDSEGVRRYRHDGSAAPPGSSVRRRRGGTGRKKKGGRGRRDDEALAMGGGNYSTLFPTEETWKTGDGGDEEYVDEDGNALSVEEARARGMRPPKVFGQPRKQVRCVPQWQYGTFAKGGVIPELGDGEEEEAYVASDGEAREVGRMARGSRTFGRYSGTGSGLRRSPRRGPDGEPLDDDSGAEGGRGPRGGRRSGRTSPFSGSGRNTPMGGSGYRGRRGTRGGPDDSMMGSGNLTDGNADGFGGARSSGRKRSPGRRKDSGRSFNPDGPLADAGQDNFNRGRSKFYSAALDESTGGTHPAGRRTPGRKPGQENPAAPEEPPRPAPMMQCAACKMPLGGENDPPFCVVTGERHF